MDGKTLWAGISNTVWGVLFIAAIVVSISRCSAFDFDIQVYVTPYGEKYHYSECYYLNDADYLNKFDNYLEAEDFGYVSCSNCENNNYSLTTKIDIKLDEK